MARFPLDFNQIEDKSFPVFPPGAYILRIIEARMENAKSSGELKETVQFEIVQGPGPSTEHAGKKIITSYTLQQQGGFRMKKLLVACGIPPERMSDMDDQELVGCTIKATVSVEAWQGRPTNKIGNEEPLQGNPAVAPASFPAPAGFGAPPAGVPAPAVPGPPGAPPAGFAAPPGAQPAPGGWAPQWGAPPNGGPGFGGQAPSPPPAKPANAPK